VSALARDTAADADTAASVVPGYLSFNRKRWSRLGTRSGSPLTAAETERLGATGEPVSLTEVDEIYRPLAQLLSVMAASKRTTDTGMRAFLGEDPDPTPFVIGIAGSVAVGKSTTARVLQALLREVEGKPSVDLLTTDGFLYPNATLEARGLMTRKGFPESYDQRRLVEALAALRSGAPEVATPLYSHLTYDIIPGQFQYFRRPAIVVVEGLNVLQINTNRDAQEQSVVSDYFDFSIYVDADEDHIARWFEERLLALRSTVLQEEESYFHRFAALPENEVVAIARQIWADINLVNLHENIAPTRGRADVILRKNIDHRVHEVLLRQT
jgi:type I pantothenate kinase